MAPIEELDARGLRRFALTMAAIVALLFGLILPFIFGLNYRLWPWIVGAVFVLWGLLAPASVRPFYRLWMRIGLVLNAIMSRVILTIVFFLVVMPTGLIMRARHRDPIAKNFDQDGESYKIASTPPAPKQMEKPF